MLFTNEQHSSKHVIKHSADEEEALPMVKNIITLSSKLTNGELLASMTVAIARFFVMDDATMAKYKIPPTIKTQLAGLLKHYCSQSQDIMNALSAEYGKQRAKFKKLSEILQ